MKLVEEITIQGVGIAATAFVIVYGFAKWITEKAFIQIEKAQAQIQKNNDAMIDFMRTTFQQNTDAINEMCLMLKEHIKTKEEAIELLKQSIRR